MDARAQLARSQDVAAKAAKVLNKRVQTTQEKFTQRVNEAKSNYAIDPFSAAAAAMNPASWYSYAVDATQRSILFWDTLWQRGNNFVEHTAQGLKPVLHFDYETVLDGRTFERPVNYALLRITPPEGVDGRSEAAALPHHRSARGPRSRHRRLQGRFAGRRRAARRAIRCTSSSSFATPSPARRCSTSARPSSSSCRKVRELHPDSAKPAIVGNCQGGWAAMMLAARRSRRHRPDRHQRRADVVLGRRVERRRGRQPDALRGRHARRHVARVADGRPGQRQVRRRAISCRTSRT